MKTYKIFFIIFLFVLASVPILAEEGTLESFRDALRQGNASQIQQEVAPGGLILVRSYNLNRGKDLVFRVNDIPDNLQIAAPNDLPFDLRYLFGGTIRARSLFYINERIPDLALNEGSVQGVRAFAQTVLEFIQSKTQSFTPTAVYSDRRFLILTEAEANVGMLSGSMAVFVRSGNGYALKLIADFR